MKKHDRWGFVYSSLGYVVYCLVVGCGNESGAARCGVMIICKHIIC